MGQAATDTRDCEKTQKRTIAGTYQGKTGNSWSVVLTIWTPKGGKVKLSYTEKAVEG